MTVAFRTTRALRARLEASARRAGRSLTEECELRLAASLGDTNALEGILGGRVNYWLFAKVAVQIENLERMTGERWWRDRYTLQQLSSLIRALLAYFEPIGEGVAPNKFRSLTGGLGAALAGRALLDVGGWIANKRMESALRKNPNAQLPKLPTRFTKQDRTEFLEWLNAEGRMI